MKLNELKIDSEKKDEMIDSLHNDITEIKVTMKYFSYVIYK